MKHIEYIWLGPDGSNTSLGLVKHGGKVNVPENLIEFFINLNLIKKEQSKKSKSKKETKES